MNIPSERNEEPQGIKTELVFINTYPNEKEEEPTTDPLHVDPKVVQFTKIAIRYIYESWSTAFAMSFLIKNGL